MRHDQSRSARRNETMGLGGILTGYAAIAIILLAFAALFVAGHRHAMAPKAVHAVENDSFGIEELVDLLAAQPAVASADVFVLPKLARAELDAGYRR